MESNTYKGVVGAVCSSIRNVNVTLSVNVSRNILLLASYSYGLAFIRVRRRQHPYLTLNCPVINFPPLRAASTVIHGLGMTGFPRKRTPW